AAAVLVGFAVFYGINEHNNQKLDKLAAQYQNEVAMSDVSRGDSDDIVAKLKPLFDLVLQGQQLDNTIETLEKYWQQSLSEPYNDFTNYKLKIGWYLAIAHLKNHDKAAAKQTLKTLIANTEEGMSIRIKAEELEKEL
ncbi:MAG: hypothetical protein K6F33_13860, partial [Bacteroidales bacterium]|nr:hypothetical protein [Bacteroidales bacterium]